MTINLSPLNTEYQINNSYLKSSYSNESYPYIKGKRYESIFGDNRIVVMDQRLNKDYISQMKKQDYILQEKKILEIIEKLDNKKAYNLLKEDYLKEKKKISKGYYLKKGAKKKEFFTNLVNLENYKEKLLTENKKSTQEGEFLTSFMKCLGCRPKKVIVKKINKKVELLSKFKSFAQRKKEAGKIKKKPKKRNSLQLLLNAERNLFIDKNNYLNFFNTTNSKVNNNYESNKKVLTLKLDDNDSNSNKKYSNKIDPFNKTNSTTFGITKYNNFYNPKDSSKYKDDSGIFNNDYFKNSFNNLKIEEIKNEQSLNNSINDSNFLKIEDKTNEDRNTNLILSKRITTKKSTKKELSSRQNLINLGSKDINNSIIIIEKKGIS